MAAAAAKVDRLTRPDNPSQRIPGTGVFIDVEFLTSYAPDGATAEEIEVARERRRNPFYIAVHGMRYYDATTEQITARIEELVRRKILPGRPLTAQEAGNPLLGLSRDDDPTKAMPGEGILIDTEYMTSADPLEAEYYYYIVINKTRYYGNSPADVLNTVRRLVKSGVIAPQMMTKKRGLGTKMRSAFAGSLAAMGRGARAAGRATRKGLGAAGRGLGAAGRAAGRGVGAIGTALTPRGDYIPRVRVRSFGGARRRRSTTRRKIKG